MLVKLPDGSERELPEGASTADLAADIGPRLAKDALIAVIDGAEADLSEPLNDGDVLLLHGSAERVDDLRRRESRLRLLGDGEDPLASPQASRRGMQSIGIFLVAILAGTTGLLPMASRV